MEANDIQLSDPPRLEVLFSLKDGKQEQFSWRICGNGTIPLMTLTGFIMRVQAELLSDLEPGCKYAKDKLVVMWHADSNRFDWSVGPGIPVTSLVGMLELIKTTLVASQIQQQQQSMAPQNGGLFGPDGQRWRR